MLDLVTIGADGSYKEQDSQGFAEAGEGRTLSSVFSLQMYVICDCDCEEDKDDDDECDDYDEDENQEGQGLVPWWQLSLQSSLQLSSTESHLLKCSFMNHFQNFLKLQEYEYLFKSQC